jgi:hypothetical protein
MDEEQEYAQIAGDIAAGARHIIEVLDESFGREDELPVIAEALQSIAHLINAAVQLRAIDLITDLEGDDDEDDEDDEDEYE